MDLSQHDFEKLRTYIHKLCGLYIHDEKRYLILQRLEDLVHASGCANFTQFTRLLADQPTTELHEQIIAAITTNETSFFRDKHPFMAFSSYILPRLAERIRKIKSDGQQENKPKVRIWSAGSSTGQEPFSLAMLIHSYAQAHIYFGIAPGDFSILGTDISSTVLNKAKQGAYSEMEVARGLSPDYLQRYFSKDDRYWKLKKEILSLVEFRKMNLTEPSGLFGEFDVIFCRNVLIYFDDATKRTILEHFNRRLTPDGFLLLGSAENLYTMTDKFESFQVGETIVYRKKKSTA